MTSTRHIRERIEALMSGDLPADVQDRIRAGIRDLIAEAQLHGRNEVREETRTERRVWCIPCQHEHIANIPVQTWQCDGYPGEEAGCGFGSWRDDIAEEHVTRTEGHAIRLVTHRVVPLDRRATVDDLDIPEARDWALRLLGAELARLHYVGHLPMSVAVNADDWEWYRNHPLTKACSERGIIWDKHLPVIMDWLSGRIADGAAMTPDTTEVIRDLRDRLTRADREVTHLLADQPKQERIRLGGKREGIRLAIDYLRGLPS